MEAHSFVNSFEFRSLVQPRFYSRGYTIFRQGARAESLYLIKSGWLQISHEAPTGKTVVDFLGPGILLGIVEAVAGTSYPFSAVAIEDCEVETITKRAFLDFIERNPPVAAELLKTVSRYFQRVLQYLYDVAGKVSPERRLLRALYEISETAGFESPHGVRIKLPLTVQAMADRIGCSRQWTSKLLNNLMSKGLIERKEGWISITPEGVKFRRGEGGHSLRTRSRRGRF